MNPLQLVIVGAGGLGCDVADMGSQCLTQAGLSGIAGFLDDRPLTSELPHPIMGAPATYVPQPHHRLIIAVGNPTQRLQYAQLMADKGVQWAQPLVHATALISAYATIAPGCAISPYSTVGVGSVIEGHTFISAHAVIGHHVHIGRACQISSFCFVGGYAQLQQGVTLQPHATITPHVCVGHGSTVGPGSVVLQSTPNGVTVFGVPALPVPTRVKTKG
jgi:sugar O-acyltransferase (sialic acid O-acetyltransferase NeuD family)